MAQAKGFRGETSDSEKKITRVKLDLFYMKNWSFFFDLKIIVATIWELLKPVKSEGVRLTNTDPISQD